MRTSLQYTVIRLLIFFVCLLLLWAIPALRSNVLLLLVLATTLSMLISVFALNNMRNRMSQELAVRMQERHDRREQQRAERRTDEVVEDAEDTGLNPPQEDLPQQLREERRATRDGRDAETGSPSVR